jgi:hypothetical protein
MERWVAGDFGKRFDSLPAKRNKPTSSYWRPAIEPYFARTQPSKKMSIYAGTLNSPKIFGPDSYFPGLNETSSL